jgi:hypothetical protein
MSISFNSSFMIVNYLFPGYSYNYPKQLKSIRNKLNNENKLNNNHELVVTRI